MKNFNLLQYNQPILIKNNRQSGKRNSNYFVESKFVISRAFGIKNLVFSFLIGLLALILSSQKANCQVSAIKGGETVEKMKKDVGYTSGKKRYYIKFKNNTGHPIWDMRIALSKSDSKIDSCEVYKDTKNIAKNKPANNSTHIKFTEPIDPDGVFEVKLFVDKDNASNTTAKIIPTDITGADLMLNNSINSSIESLPKPTKLIGGKTTITFSPSNFPSLDYKNNTGQKICDFRIDNLKKADGTPVKIDSVFVNGVKVSATSGIYSTHVYFPDQINVDENFTVTIKCNGENKAVTCKVMPTNKDSADMVYKMVPLAPKAMNDPKNGTKTIFFDDTPGNPGLVPTQRPSIVYENKTNSTICDIWTAIPKGNGTNNPKIVKVIVNGEEWPIDVNAKTDTIVHLLGPAGMEIKKDTTFSVTVVLENGTVTEMTVTPTDSAHNIITVCNLNGGKSNFLFDNRLGIFGSMGRSASLTATNASCSSIGQLTFSSPTPGVTILNAGSSLTSYFNSVAQTLYFTPPVAPGELINLNYIINNLMPYSPTDSFPYTTISISGPGTDPFDGFLETHPTTCSTAVNGSIDLVITAGLSPYWFLWSNGATTEDLTNVSSGTYTVTVTSPSGCFTKVCDVAAGQPVLSVAGINTWCNGIPNGEAIVLHDGFTEPLNFLWSNGSSIQHTLNLAPGNYTVWVNDLSGCAASAGVLIQSPQPFILNGTVTNAACAGTKTGSIDVFTLNGAGVYSYKWNNNSVLEDRNALAAGIYSLTATDGFGCMAYASFVVGQPTALAIATTKISVKCSGKSTGKATAIPSGGIVPYTYNWSNGSTTNPATGLAVGTYTVTVTDLNGCTKTKSVSITGNAAIGISISPVSSTACNAIATGGVPPYTYSWNTIPVQTTQLATGLSQGQNYTVTIKDDLNCSKSLNFTMGAIKSGSPSENKNEFGISVSPNPTKGILQVTSLNFNSEKFSVILSDLTGRIVYSEKIQTETGSMYFNFTEQSKGMYMLIVSNGENQQIKKLVIE